MVLIDINVLIYAYRDDSNRHKDFRGWMEQILSSQETFSVPSVARSGFLRIVTNPRVYLLPTPVEEAVGVLDDLMARPNFTEVNPGPRHWSIFTDLCRKAQAKGNLITDAYLAALAIECGGEWITADKHYARFPGLRWRHPLDVRYGPGGHPGHPSAQEPRRRYRARMTSASKTVVSHR